MTKLLGRLLGAALALGAPFAAPAQGPAPVIVVNLAELSGAGAIAGTNFVNGVELAFKEINAAGGILGQRIQVVTFDTESKPEVAEALAQRALALRPYAVMGPVFSGITLAAMDEMRRAEVPTFTGGEAASSRQKGNPYLFRTSFNAGDRDAPARALHQGRRPRAHRLPSSGSTTSSAGAGATR